MLPSTPSATVANRLIVACRWTVLGLSGHHHRYATYEKEDGSISNDGLSILDLVKHATKAVMHILDEGDRCSVVAFNRSATTIFQLTAMTDADRDPCVRQLLALEEGGGTNLWAGVFAGLECLRAGQEGAQEGSIQRKATLMLLTDGRPTVTPPRGFIEELRTYSDTNPGFAFQLSTFGFGYVGLDAVWGCWNASCVGLRVES